MGPVAIGVEVQRNTDGEFHLLLGYNKSLPMSLWKNRSANPKIEENFYIFYDLALLAILYQILS